MLLIVLLTTATAFSASAQRPPAPKKVEPQTDLAKLRDEYVKATKEYKASLEKLLGIHEKNARRAEDRLAQSRSLFEQGLISKRQLDESELAVETEKAKISEVHVQLSTADMQIANTLVEADAEAKLAKAGGMRRGALVRTTSYVRYNGNAFWSLSDAWKVQRFFQDSFKRPLPIAVFGQGAIHDRWRLDHRNSIDVSLNPDSLEGVALMNFLRANGIPFLAFRGAIPGAATGPHIHVGRPSHRY